MSDIQVNPLLAQLKLPGRIFQLPSRGIFYTNGELEDNVKDGEIHVQPMSALDEINIKNPDQLFSGAAVETVFKSCVSGVNKPSDLLAKDVDAIMMFLRTVTYGPDYEFTAKHRCEGAKEHSYVANVEQMIGQMKMIDPTQVDKQYTVTLPNGQIAKMNPNRYQQMLEIVKLNQNKTQITVEEQQRNIILMLKAVIHQVDDITNEAMIEEWLRKIPPTFVNRIAERSESVNEWGPNLRWKCVCKDCGEEFDVEIPINPVSFFNE
jgi:hypothetical protein